MKNRSGTDEILRCSFCHKSQDAVAKLISSPSDYPRAYICDECVAVCNSILEDDRTATPESSTPNQLPKPQEVKTFLDEYVIGQAASMAALLLAAGEAKKRLALPNSRILIHQPSMGGLSGQATDIDIHAREILRMREITNQLLSKHSGQKLDKVEKDVERDFIMNAQQAKEYGIIDDIIYKTK